jgi:hypothetical protein
LAGPAPKKAFGTQSAISQIEPWSIQVATVGM